jgi:hypothetical protein
VLPAKLAKQEKDMSSSIDLTFRPHTYFWAKDLGIQLVSDIKGANRRRIYEKALQDGDIDDLDPNLFSHELSEKDRQAIGHLHPWCLGGEYLPGLRAKEVEIARITIASTTQDVTCVYARPSGKRIAYRIVDEYDGQTLAGVSTCTSHQPLALNDLAQFIIDGWGLWDVLEMNFADQGYPPKEVHDFILDASSSFYPAFGDLIRARVDAWLDEVASYCDQDKDPDPDPDTDQDQDQEEDWT